MQALAAKLLRYLPRGSGWVGKPAKPQEAEGQKEERTELLQKPILGNVGSRVEPGRGRSGVEEPFPLATSFSHSHTSSLQAGIWPTF